jgi:adenine-specific DNA-methyltransferase
LAKRTRKKEEDIEAYRHETETRKNVVPVGLISYATSTPKPKKYQYDPHLDPQLVWTGKAENTSFEVPTVSLHIHERISAETVVRLFGGFGKWGFMAITDLRNAKDEIRKFTESDTLV